nr:pentatricopeptide repeat-containing protein [Tanacetum cinerariifolium]
MFIEFVIQNQFIFYFLEEFAQILDIPYVGACVFTDKWSLVELAYGVPTDCPYQDIILYIRINREGQFRRIRHEEEINVHEHQILIREIVPTLKPWEEIIRENVFCLGGNQDNVPACLCYMLYNVANSEKFNLAYYMAKRMERVTKQARLILHYERKTRKDRGMSRHFTSSSAFDQPSFSHLNDDDDGNSEGTSLARTLSPIRFVNSLTNDVLQVVQNSPNIYPHMEPLYTCQTKIINHQVQFRDEHRGRLKSIEKDLKNL